jgi:uncharacterized circularly permuted ATP-grasp superfamily protein/uncharacterized alpha-E superfamily protein
MRGSVHRKTGTPIQIPSAKTVFFCRPSHRHARLALQRYMMESPPTADSSAKPFGEYRPSPGIYDEMASAPGIAREHWQTLAGSFDQLGRDELAIRWENARRMIREHGVTYNIYGDPQGMDRPWELDMVPLLVPPPEWAALEAGLIQRARLFNLILADLYGQQRLLREGLLPPALVFANAGFLRPCHGVRVPRDIYLHLHAADLARSPDGQWWVLADRTQAPSGTGYALENRIVLARILPDEFRDSRVQRLASFFQMERDTLRGLAPEHCDNPNVVLLTPGPHNETYFEHAYLARYLGFTLVEGGDLTVRDRHVFIKTLEGLQPVDVILRRVDDTFCDPLELRGDSFLGVPGLVEATRAGHVTVANALGSGLIESSAFLAFLPSLCRHLLGEELKLPSVATWWCGQAKEQRYVIEHLDEIVVKLAFGKMSGKLYFGEKLDRAQRAELVAAIQARPHDFVGQERVALSTAPVWQEGRLEPRCVVLRAYTTATGDSFTVMPGGLTRVSTTAADPMVTMQSGGGSKDTWVLSEAPVSQVSLLTPAGQPVSSVRIATELPSRVADNLFWLGRYIERLEDTVRLLRCIIARLADESAGEGSAELTALAQVLVSLKLLPERFEGRARLADFEKEILLLVYNQQRPGGVRQLSSRIHQIASIVRDRFSADTWRILNQLQLDLRSRPGRLPLANTLALLNTLIIDLGAFNGMAMENMTRGHGWRFLDFGRRLERGFNLAALLQAGLSTEDKTGAVLQPLLEVADSAMTYRRRYFAQAQLEPVLELLVLDEGNPRALAFQLNALADHAAGLPRDASSATANSEGQRIAGLVNGLRANGLSALGQLHDEGVDKPLADWLAGFGSELTALSDDLTQHYFSHTVARVS